MEDHAKRCSDIIAWSNPGKAFFEDKFEKGKKFFRTKMFHAEGELFFFRLMKKKDFFDAEISLSKTVKKTNLSYSGLFDASFPRTILFEPGEKFLA